MPELPEVETIRRRLAPVLEGRRLTAIDVLDPRWCSPIAPGELAAAVKGRVIERLSRRGKYLIWELEDDIALLVHLRMTGNLLHGPGVGELPYLLTLGGYGFYWFRLEAPTSSGDGPT